MGNLRSVALSTNYFELKGGAEEHAEKPTRVYID
jgi:hypothetical protein